MGWFGEALLRSGVSVEGRSERMVFFFGGWAASASCRRRDAWSRAAEPSSPAGETEAVWERQPPLRHVLAHFIPPS